MLYLLTNQQMDYSTAVFAQMCSIYHPNSILKSQENWHIIWLKVFIAF